MISTLGEDTPQYSIVNKWAAEFKCGRESLEDYSHPRKPVTVASQDHNTIHDIVMANRWVNKRGIATKVGVSHEHVHAILHSDLQMLKVPACLLGPD